PLFKQAMVRELITNTVADFKSHYAELKADQSLSRVFVLFMAGTDPDTGDSWCPDCRNSEPHIEAAVKGLGDDVAFLAVDVGDRPGWKSPDCPFRHLDEAKVTGVPTLFEMKSGRELNGDDCQDGAKVAAFFA
ncbi:hypothetical protein BOX15_Mlig017778g2, partial [Macrostomum lignano]